MTLRVYLLGSVEIYRDDNLVDLPGLKPAALLAYLLMTAKSHSRQHMVDVLYDDSSDPRASLRWTLSHLRKAIGKAAIHADRQQIGFNFDTDYWFDVAELLAGDVEQYRGELLPGVYLRDAPQFMEWLLFEREHLRTTYQTHLMQQLTQSRQRRAHAETAVLAQKLLLLDNLREEWHQALIEAYMQQGQREAALAQYKLCEQVLTKELGIEPAAETAALVATLQNGGLVKVSPSVSAGVVFTASVIEESVLPDVPFVSREQELEKLHTWLENAVDGQGKVVFVTGMAGQGKSALLHAFARQAMTVHPNLLVASGQGNAYADIGDPYLPFRDVMTMLIGCSKAGFLSTDHIRRLQSVGPMTINHILEYGADLANIFVPASVVEAHLTAVSDKHNGEYQFQRPTSDLPQTAVFQQFTNVLNALAAQQPLLLLLDDLQWVDTSSISLLFHLGRRLSNSRILIVGAYRPEEVAMDGNGRRHPLQSVLAEFKRLSGDVWINLGESPEAANRRFVEAYLDKEPNQLDHNFRQALFEHTGGHPLFTVELLRSLQERGDLIHNDDGEWVVGSSLNWDRLPARVEAVISERIGRLETELRELLQVASVEGETFTTQVLAKVQAVTERQLLRQLSQALNQQHRLVQEDGEVQVNQQFIYQYRFAHALFQRYLYNELSLAERRLLHREIGQMLETVYGDTASTIAGQLARHFEEANLPTKAIHYLRLAGEQAEQKYAHDEAIAYFSRVLALLPEDHISSRFELLLAREKVFNIMSDRNAQKQDLAALEKLLPQLPEGTIKENRAEIFLRRADYANVTSDFPTAVSAAKAVIAQSQETNNKRQEATAYLAWGLALFRQGEFEPARQYLTQAMTISHKAKFHDLNGDSLRILGLVARSSGRHQEAVTFYSQGLEFSQEFGDWIGEGYALNNLGSTFKDQGFIEKAKESLEKALQIFQKKGHPHGEAQVQNNLGDLARHFGNYKLAKSIFKHALTLCREMNEKFGESIILDNLARVSCFLGDFKEGCQFAEDALILNKKIGNQRNLGFAQECIANCLLEMGKNTEAIAYYQESINLRRELQQFHMVSESQAGLAWAHFVNGDHGAAKANVEEILDYLKTGTVEGTEEPLRIYWICYQILQANEDSRANTILKEAFSLLHQKADIIKDKALRRSFLENIPFHREIIRACEEM